MDSWMFWDATFIQGLAANSLQSRLQPVATLICTPPKSDPPLARPSAAPRSPGACPPSLRPRFAGSLRPARWGLSRARSASTLHYQTWIVTGRPKIAWPLAAEAATRAVEGSSPTTPNATTPSVWSGGQLPMHTIGNRVTISPPCRFRSIGNRQGGG